MDSSQEQSPFGFDDPGPTDPAVADVDELLGDVAATFVRMADTLVDDYDMVDFAATLSQESRRLLANDAAGVMLASGPEELRILAATDESTRLLQLCELEVGEGPAYDAHRTGATVTVVDLAVEETGWTRFSAHAVEHGFRAVTAIPMAVRDQRVGVLNLFNQSPCVVPPSQLRLAKGLADVATIGILAARRIRDEKLVTRQLQEALTSRVVLEQAKGTLAERFGMDVDEAFEALRRYARSRRRHLSDVAAAVVAGELHSVVTDRPVPGRRVRATLPRDS